MLSLFMAGLAGSVTHCTGMCGPFVMSFTPAASDNKLERLKGLLLLPYHMGRMTTYVLLGIIAGLFASHTAHAVPLLGNTLPAALLAIGGLLFFLQFLGFSGLTVQLPSLPRAMQMTITGLSKSPTGWRGYVMGIILGFLPCGLLLSAVLIAASAPHWWMAGTGMALFALATMPALNAVAIFKNHITSKKPEWINGIRKGLTLANSIALFILAGVRLS